MFSFRFLNSLCIYNRNSFFYENISGFEVLKIINSLKGSNSTGDDEISSNILKKIALYVVDVLAYLLNLSVLKGTFPESLKKAYVIPVFKKGARKDKINYRPISLLSVLSKVFEKAMKSRILNYLTKLNFFNSKQFGFRENCSTEDALLDFCENIYKGLDAKKLCAGLFVDITKAFDTIDHEILLKKLFSVGFRGFILDWFCSYLKNRSQRVKNGNSLSDSKIVGLGVPQGSVLGPILFLIYINSVFELPFAGTVEAFADDIAFAYVSNNYLDLVADINRDVHLLRVWFAKHKLIVSKKTKLMCFSFHNTIHPDFYIIFHAANCPKASLQLCDCYLMYNEDKSCNDDCFTIDIVTSYKYLGVLIDCNLSWSDHIMCLKQYLLSSLRCFYRLSNYCSSKVLRNIYFGIFHSKLQYGISCWGGAYSNKIQQLTVLQKYMIRKICKTSRLAHSMELFKRLKILPARHLFYFKVLKNFFIRSGYLQGPISDTHNLRSNMGSTVVIPRFRTSRFRNFFSVLSCKIFNALPQNIRVVRILSIFLKKIKMWLLSIDHNEIENLMRYMG